MTIPRNRFLRPPDSPAPIDHASREPGEPPPFDLRPLVYQAVLLSGGQATGLFTSEAFAVAVVRRFGIRGRPDAAWCSRVLRGLWYVAEVPGRVDTWRTRMG
jgi:hypothetical protein